jgi:hypothetical protein
VCDEYALMEDVDLENTEPWASLPAVPITPILLV